MCRRVFRVHQIGLMSLSEPSLPKGQLQLVRRLAESDSEI